MPRKSSKRKTSKQNNPQKQSFNAVAVYNENGHQVRLYSQKQHGDNFVSLAAQYSEARNTTYLKELTIDEGIDCPACGHNFVV